MKQRIVVAPFTLIVALMLIVLRLSSVNAQQPPADWCTAVSKVEYDSAKKQGLLRDRFGIYVRTGRFLQRYYWYCR